MASVPHDDIINFAQILSGTDAVEERKLSQRREELWSFQLIEFMIKLIVGGMPVEAQLHFCYYIVEQDF